MIKALTQTALLTLALLCVASSAQAATYTASYTAPDTHWSYNETGGPYSPLAFGSQSGDGSFSDWSMGGWRLTAPDPTISIVVANLSGSAYTPNPDFHGRIRTGIGSQGTVQFDTTSNGTWSRTLTGSFNWVQAELMTRTYTQTTGSGGNNFKLSGASITFSDATAPALTIGSPPTGWHAADCIPFSYAASDAGSRIWTATIKDQTTIASIDAFQSARNRPAQPGTQSIARTSCVPPTSEGQHTVNVTATDYAGNSTNNSFAVKFDLSGPTLQTTIDDGQRYSSYNPPLPFTVSDHLSGLASMTASIDGNTTPHSVDGDTLTVRSEDDLALGRHTVTVTAVDKVGNTTRSTRAIVIEDDVDPEITIHSPQLAGDNTPVLDVTADDDKSGIDPETWVITVNGRQVVSNPFNDRILVNLGYLANQQHTISIRVRDRSGNAISKTIHYTAASTSGAAALPGITGIYALTKPRKVRVGQTIRVRVAAVKYGRPLAGLRAELRQKGKTIAAKPITEDGTVNIQAKLYYRKPVTIVVDGSGLRAKRVPLIWRRR